MVRLLFILALLFSAPAAAAAALVGSAAPSVSWTDIDGHKGRLADYRGRIVVLEWTSPACPYSRFRYDTGALQKTQKRVIDQGGIWLTLLSDGPGESGYLTVTASRKLLAKRKAHPTALIRDTDSHIARVFRATATPHIAIIDQRGVLVYSGAFDSNPSAWEADGPVRNYVLEALKAIKAGRDVAVPMTRSYGCMIRYAR